LENGRVELLDGAKGTGSEVVEARDQLGDLLERGICSTGINALYKM